MASLRDMMNRHGGKCFWCHCEVFVDPKRHLHDNHATRDHVYPRKDPRRTAHTGVSLLLSCRKCNQMRGDMPFEDFKALMHKPQIVLLEDKFDFSSFQRAA